MSALTFDKSELGNLEYSLQREMLATDRKGGYMSTTIVCCNTRKYHGLMVAPIDETDEAYVLLSSLDETIIQHDQSFNLALHRYKGGCRFYTEGFVAMPSGKRNEDDRLSFLHSEGWIHLVYPTSGYGGGTLPGAQPRQHRNSV